MNDVVKYHNDFNKIRLPSFTEQEQNMLFGIITKIREKPKDKFITFTPQELLSFSDKQITHTELTTILQTLKTKFFKSDFTILVQDENDKNLIGLKTINLFTEFTIWVSYKSENQMNTNINSFNDINPLNPINDIGIDFLQALVGGKGSEKLDKLTLGINPDFAYLINDLTANFTRFELAEFIALSGKYTKTLYRLLKQYRSTGYLKMEWNEFLRVMDIPENYTQGNIDQRILKPAKKQLSQEINLFDQARIPFKNLVYKKYYIKGRGRYGSVASIEFTFKPQQTEIQVKDDGKKVTDIDIQQWEKYAHNALNGAYRYEYKGNFYQFYDTKIKDNNPQLEAYLILTELQENDNNDLEPTTKDKLQISFKNIKHLLEKIRENKVIRMLD